MPAYNYMVPAHNIVLKNFLYNTADICNLYKVPVAVELASQGVVHMVLEEAVAKMEEALARPPAAERRGEG